MIKKAKDTKPLDLSGILEVIGEPLDLSGIRVVLNNPSGYRGYKGTVEKVFPIGTQEWAFVDWDTPVYPCSKLIETRHLFGISS